MPKLEISKKEYERRRQCVLEKMGSDLDAICLFGPTNIFYLTNYGLLVTERPVAFIFTKNYKANMFIPSLEKDRIKNLAYIDDTKVWPDYPGEKHPMQYLKEYFHELGLEDKTLGVDAKGYPGKYGYEGPDLEEILPHATIKPTVGKTLREMMMVKSKEGIELIRESVRWGAVAHKKLQEFSAPGRNETYVSSKASLEASMEMINELGNDYRAIRQSSAGAFAGFRGQVGKNSANPHAVTINAIMKRGDLLVTGASATVGGYNSELERTMVIGKPTEKQQKYFNYMKQAQEIAFEKIKPGVKCSEVDKAVRNFYREQDLMDYWRHHTGHSLGLEGHEPPFFDVGDDTKLKPGMVMSVEPGIYIPDFGGFRHSDTVLVTDDGMERLTKYPRTLEKLAIPV